MFCGHLLPAQELNLPSYLSAVTSDWQTYQLKQRKGQNDKNFKMLNKMATRNRVTTASAQNRFRQSLNDVRLVDPVPQRKYVAANLQLGK